MADNTVFDSVFKTLVHKAPKLMIPFINETFGRNYPEDSTIVQFSDEHNGPRGTIIDDTVFRLEDKIYHVECQSTPDSNMVIRMIEYDFAIALEGALVSGAPYEMEFPASCVLFLRHTAQTPDVLRMKVNLPDGGSFEYRAKVMKAQLYSSDEIFQKRLLLLLPYYLMRYEKTLGEIAASDDYTSQLLNECSSLRVRLESATLGVGDTTMYKELTELIIKVSDYVFAAHETLRKKVRGAMGGEILELLGDKIERLEREAEEARARGFEQGMEQGIEQGIERGIERGIEQGIEQGSERATASLVARLIELGVDKDVIDAAIASLRAEQD